MKRLFFYSLMLFIALFFTTCFDNTSGDIKTGDEVILKTKIFDSYLHVEFVDAKTGELLREKEVTVTVKGKDAAWVYNNVGLQTTAYKTRAGYYDLAVDITKSTGDFVIEVATNEYEKFIYHVRLNSAKFSTVKAQLIKKDNLPEGVYVAQPQIIATNPAGETTQEISISPDQNNTVLFPRGTVFKDKNGNKLTGNLEPKIVFYDPKKTVDFFPGGLNVEILDENNIIQNVIFTSAGLFDIELTSGNNTVKTIEGEGIVLSTIISSDLINPTTESPVAEGDEIQLWSMDPETAVWKYEKTTSVKKNSNGQLYLSETINHLSSWNWDWAGATCYEGTKILWEKESVSDPNVQAIVRIINKTPLNSYSSQTTVWVDLENDPYLQFYNVPQNIPAVLSFESEGLAFIPSTHVINNLCDNTKTWTVKVIGPTAYKVNLDLNITAESNPNVKVQVSCWAYIYKDDSYAPGQNIFMTNNKSTAYFEEGKDYVISVTVANGCGYGYARIDDIGNNKLKLSFSPEFIYFYSNNMNWYESKKELIIDKPAAGNAINLSIDYKMKDEILNMLK